MPSVHDVAAYILQKQGQMTAMKLEKLVYYCQAWSLAWDEAPLFDEPIEAWANGPVVPALFSEHRGQYFVSDWPKGDANNVSSVQIDTIKAVLNFYGDKTSQWLSDLSHSEQPWIDARAGLPSGIRGHSVISHDSMAFYYQGLS